MSKKKAAQPVKPPMTPEERSAEMRRRVLVKYGGKMKEPPPNAVEIIMQASANGCTIEEMAKALGVGRNTFQEWTDKYPALQQAVTAGRTVEHDKLVGKLFEMAMKGNVVSALFLLKTRHGYTEGVPLVQNSVSINYNLPAALTPEQYVKTVEATATAIPPDAARKLVSDSKVKKALKHEFAMERRKLEDDVCDE